MSRNDLPGNGAAIAALPAAVTRRYPKIELLIGIGSTFVLGAWVGASTSPSLQRDGDAWSRAAFGHPYTVQSIGFLAHVGSVSGAELSLLDESARQFI